MSNFLENDIEKLNLNETEESNDLYGFMDNKYKNLKPKKITLKLILERNLNMETRDNFKTEYKDKFEFDQQESNDDDEEATTDKAEIKARKLLKLTHIHLDREQIDEIDNLAEYLGDVSNLYLQGNLIKRIENLEFLHKLKFLILSSNQIEKIENLTNLKQLKLLDLSYNLIDDIDVKELPKSIIFLDLRENECLTGPRQTWLKKSFKSLLTNHLSNLKQLNGKDILLNSDDEEKEQQIDEREDDIEEEDSREQLDTFQMLSERIIERSKQRQSNDAICFDEISQQRKIRMDEARQSIDKNLKFVKK